ncbi:MAG: ABC transporter substrate-binding protein [Chloroflexi bacterium]|nr:ABC transporter substrate-binding protein [Chloroflexota bacterium]
MIFGPSFRVSLANSALLTLIAASMAALLLTSISCGLLEDDGGNVTVGTVMPVSGDLSTLGPAAQSSISLAFDLINEAGGVNGSQIEVFHRDSGTNATLGADAASGLVNINHANFIMAAHASPVTIAIAESVTIPNGVLQISPGSSSKAISALDDNDMVFRTRVNDGIKAQALAKLAQAIGYKRVSTTYVNNAYGESLNESFVENFEAIGGIVSAAVPHELGQASYVSELRDASEEDPEALITIAYPDSGTTLLREAAEGGYFDEFIFVDQTKSQSMFDTIGGNHFDGSFGLAPGSPETPAVRDFRRVYSERTGNDPDAQIIAEAFDAAIVLALAIEQADTDDPVTVRDQLRSVANPPGEAVGPGDIPRALELIRDGKDINYEGAAGSIDFDENGDVLSSMRVWQMVDGKIQDTDIFAFPGDDINLPSVR